MINGKQVIASSKVVTEALKEHHIDDDAARNREGAALNVRPPTFRIRWPRD